MGYYSIYKIFQDIIRKLFNAKIWKICLIIIAFIILYCNFSKVFAYTAEDYTSNTIVLENNTQTFTIGSVDSFGIVTVTLPSFYNDFDNILVSAYYPDKDTTARGIIILSNEKIFVDNKGVIRGVSGGSYYFRGITYSKNSNGFYFNMSDLPLSSFELYPATNVAWWHELDEGSYSAIRGNIYDYSNPDDVLTGIDKDKYPQVANSLNDLQALNFDVVSINAWDWSNKDFDILFYDRNNVDTSTTEGLYPKRVITLNKETPYYQPTLSADPDKNAIFWIPIEETGLNFYVGGNYEIKIAERQPIQRWWGLS